MEATLLEHIPAAVVVSDAENRVAYCNRAARELYGCVEGAVIPPALADTAHATMPWEGNLTVSGRLVHCRSSPVHDSAKRRVGTMTVSLVQGSDQAGSREENLTEVGRRIAVARAAAGLTQQELADRLGVTRRSVQGYESGSIAPYRHVQRLSELLGRPVGWFLLDDRVSNAEALQEILRQHRVSLESDLRRIVREEVDAIR
jgi:transcriptional regulator with XRE-family HTH domain